MSSPSDQDMSDSSCSGTSYMTNSPSHQVPQLTNEQIETSCGTKPYLRIIEQPQNRFRFRYISELAGTHGCLLSKSSAVNNIKSYPSVELRNYSGAALIRCTLAQHNNPNDHPHRLHDEEDRDVSQLVPEQGSYRVGFRGIGIIHTSKKELQSKCKNMAKTVNLNIVRLKFSAHDVHTGEEICAPVFSENIQNLKSAATNDLKIVKTSRSSGSASGGDDVFIFVEKVNKKHVRIGFFELDETGQKRIWEGIGQFTPSDVHHQYAIAFRTPAYKDRKTSVDVTVYMELVRTTDGQKSDPVEFKYKAEDFYKQRKRKKPNASYHYDYASSNAVQTIPVTPMKSDDSALFAHVESAQPQISHVPEYSPAYSLNEPLYTASPNYSEISALTSSETIDSPASDPMWVGASPLLNMNLNSEDYETMQNLNPKYGDFANVYLKHLASTSGDKLSGSDDIFQWLQSTDMVSDSAHIKEGNIEKSLEVDGEDDVLHYQSAGPVWINGNDMMFETEDRNLTNQAAITKNIVKGQVNFNPIDVKKPQTKKKHRVPNSDSQENAFYKKEDGIVVKKLIKELCEMIKDKKSCKKQDIRDRLEMLFEKRMSNGDTFLHMSLCSDQTCLEYIVTLIRNVKATYLLDCSNDKLQTTLHLAVLHDLPKIVYLLVTNGADPMLKDCRDLNAIHYAVKLGSCLEPLLEAIKKSKIVYDINDFNSERQSAVHMAVIEDSGRSARLLLQAGASYSVRDEYGRTPLHLAAYDDSLEVTKALLEFIPESDIDVTDNSGNTALQIVCGGTVRENSVAITRLLLEKKANPMKTENGRESAWRLVKNKPVLKAVVWDYVSVEFKDGDENDDDVFVSADEGESDELDLSRLCLNNEMSALSEVKVGSGRAVLQLVRNAT